VAELLQAPSPCWKTDAWMHRRWLNCGRKVTFVGLKNSLAMAALRTSPSQPWQHSSATRLEPQEQKLLRKRFVSGLEIYEHYRRPLVLGVS